MCQVLTLQLVIQKEVPGERLGGTQKAQGSGYLPINLKEPLNILQVWPYQCILTECRTCLHVQLTLVIHRFRVCKFAYFLKCICNSKINTHDVFLVICGHLQSMTNLSLPMHTFPAEVKQGDALNSCFSCHTEVSRGWRQQGAVQYSARSSGSGDSWLGFESQLWPLLVGRPQANHLILQNLIFSR